MISKSGPARGTRLLYNEHERVRAASAECELCGASETTAAVPLVVSLSYCCSYWTSDRVAKSHAGFRNREAHEPLTTVPFSSDVAPRSPLETADELPSVLVVDDDTILLRAAQRILEREGYRVVACRRGEEALEQLDHRHFDVLLSDVQMPGLGGDRLLRAVRERELEIPVVLVTGTPGLESAVAAIEHRALLYLIKPLTAERLIEAVARARQSTRQVRWADQERHSIQPIVSAVSATLYAHELRCTAPVRPERARAESARLAQIIARQRQTERRQSIRRRRAVQSPRRARRAATIQPRFARGGA